MLRRLQNENHYLYPLSAKKKTIYTLIRPNTRIKQYVIVTHTITHSKQAGDQSPAFLHSHRSYLIAIVVKQSVPKILDFHHGCQVFQNETCAIAEQLFCLAQLKSYSKKSHQTIGNISLIERSLIMVIPESSN